MTKCGYVTIIGKTNVGKSTFLNNFLEEKVSITSSKSQTTRSNIFAVRTSKDLQTIFIDTPGIHKKNDKALNKILRKKPGEVIHDVDVVIFMVAGTKFDDIDQECFELMKTSDAKKILVINKIDLVKHKPDLYEFVTNHFGDFSFDAVIPMCAEKSEGIEIVEQELNNLMPENDFFYPDGEFNFQSETFEISETIREKVIRLLGDELPYETAVALDTFNRNANEVSIGATIFVLKESQKKIVIGKDGSKIKAIGVSARKDLEKKLDSKVVLNLWCKVKKNWVNNPITLESLGIKN
ncbi:MAG: GTPase Era [Gammaproteobacteria bacterium]